MQPQPSQAPPNYERAYLREKQARKKAELLLENRSRELYEANQRIERQLQKLQAAQAQLVQSEKMASVGQLAAGIAHEINNPVAFVRSNLSTLDTYIKALAALIADYEALGKATKSGDEAGIKAALTAIDAACDDEDFEFVLEDSGDIIKESTAGADRVTSIVQGLKNFSRLDENEVKEVDINEGIESTLKIAWNEIKYRCDVEKSLGDLPMIRCFPGQLNQVFLNLLVNAAQAIEGKGKVHITSYRKDDSIFVDFADDGCGIPEENLESIFNPFFTTKDVGEGTGLGLSISYAIVQKHNGDISVCSEVGKGTTFTIQLPLSGPGEHDGGSS